VVDSKLNDVLKDLILLEQQGKVTQFLTGAEDMDKVVSMVDDIRDAIMEYQVCPPCPCFLLPPYLTSTSDFVTARYLL
jgi:hypothetical protein